MTVPLAPIPPSLTTTSYREHPMIRSRLDVVDGDIGLLVLRDHLEHCYVTDPLERDTQLVLAGTASELELYQALGDRIHDDGIWARTLDELANLDWIDADYEIWGSPRSTASIHLSTFMDPSIYRPEHLDTEFCRDDECNGEHLWWGIEFDPSFGRRGYFIWHINLESGLPVPPTPMVVTGA